MPAVRNSNSLQAVEEASEDASTPPADSEASDDEFTSSSEDESPATTPASGGQDAFHPAQSTSDWANMDAVSWPCCRSAAERLGWLSGWLAGRVSGCTTACRCSLLLPRSDHNPCAGPSSQLLLLLLLLL